LPDTAKKADMLPIFVVSFQPVTARLLEISEPLLTNKSQHTKGNNIKPLITRMNTDKKKWARVHSLREWGRVKQKLCKQACKIFAFFCQSQLVGIIRAHLRNPWLVFFQPRLALGLLKT
jgi:hypothetical protein